MDQNIDFLITIVRINASYIDRMCDYCTESLHSIRHNTIYIVG